MSLLSPDPDRCSQMHRCLAVPVPTFRLRDSLSECYITGRCLPAMTPRVLVMGDEIRTEEHFFRWTITINSFTGRGLPSLLAHGYFLHPGKLMVFRSRQNGFANVSFCQRPGSMALETEPVFSDRRHQSLVGHQQASHR